MDMPKPGKQHEKLIQAFGGDWTGVETMSPSPWCPEGAEGTSTVKAKKALDGFYLVQDYVQKMGNKVSFRGHGILGYDATKKKYTMNWFDSMGCGAEPAYGTFSGKRLVFDQASEMGHMKYIFGVKSDTEYTFKMDHSMDGQSFTTMMKATYTRKA